MEDSISFRANQIAERERLVFEGLDLVKVIARGIHRNLPAHVDLDDLIQTGSLGLIEAASKYSPGKNVPFSSYAKHRITGAILDKLRQLDWVSRNVRRRQKHLERVRHELSTELQRTPIESEIAERLGVDLKQLREAMFDMGRVHLISTSSPPSEHEGLVVCNLPSNAESRPDNICSKSQIRSILGVAMKTLPNRYQEVMSGYYAKEMTMKEIGRIMGINESRVSQIHKSALERMQVTLQDNGIHASQVFEGF